MSYVKTITARLRKITIAWITQ